MTGDTVTGVVDRVVDGETAVILLEENAEVRDQLEVGVDRLPDACQHEGAVLAVEITEDGFVDATCRPEETKERKRRLQERLDRLSERLADREQ